LLLLQPAPEIQAFLKTLSAVGNDLDDLSRKNVAEIRSVREELARRPLREISVESVRNFTVPGAGHAVAVRLYVPYDKQLAREGKLPVVIFFHGGGWSLGSVNTYDSITRAIARQVPALVLSVDYRLAPENPFPAALQDAGEVLRWVKLHAPEIGGDPHRIVVAGDSAGGTLATVAAMHAGADAKNPLVMQVLFYPSTNISSTNYESYRQYGESYVLTQKAVETFREFYLPRESDWVLPEVSPLLAKNFEGMPPALIVGAGCDPLRDEGEAYAQKLRHHGIRVIHRFEPQLIHAFLNFYNFEPACSPYAEGVLGYVVGVVREAFDRCKAQVLH
jgi:acetyl esterase